jgi:hypothetical protein
LLFGLSRDHSVHPTVDRINALESARNSGENVTFVAFAAQDRIVAT